MPEKHMRRQLEARLTAEQAQARRFWSLVNRTTEALFPGVKRYTDLADDEKNVVRAFVLWLHDDTSEGAVN